MLMALLSTLSIVLGLRVISGAPWALPMLGLVLGLGFLAKGPIALLLPGLGLLLLAWRTRREPPAVSAAGLTTALLLFAAAGLGWFLLIYLRLGAAPLEHFFLRENLQRFAASTYDSGRGPFFYLAAYVAVGAPWSLCLPVAAWRALQRGATGEADGGARFLLAWTALMLVPLSLSRGKIDYYLLPLLPPLSLVVGRWLTGVAWTRLDRVLSRLACVALAAALLASPLLLGRIDPGWIAPGARHLAVGVAVAGGLVLLAAVLLARPRVVLGSLASVSAAVALTFVTVVVPAFLDDQPNARIVRDVGALLTDRPGARVVMCQDPTRVQRDILFENRAAVEERCDLWAAVSGREPAILLARDSEFAGMRRSHRLRLRYKYRYLPANILALDPEPARPGRLFLITNDGRLGRRPGERPRVRPRQRGR
jgi:4-amino-4-deoxy-L-arabinose transferase-like glycosyltransferase